jgi:hypothetical protein
VTDTLDELEAIRARHTQAEVRGGDTWDSGHVEWVWSDAHADRATLLRLLDAAREELKALKRSQALDELVAISQEAGLYDDPPPTRAALETKL